eukprot:CAMPEP_0115178646 /NCGR_PEP_ID=MMETSP0270-20121206/6006_1 /TAXON_ID=71861 /ORGANISM="Scrippsiella trochoidea, Strain CCMP3099" /LENGTH=175 /DNA_ID=CAMNT_0002591611 /DNA_START=59 /DNA_END=586 /DNA_ORIENTATION=-
MKTGARSMPAFLQRGSIQSGGQTCPGSPAMMHAKCLMQVSFPSSSCEKVQEEVLGRMRGTNGWTDPHNGGQYTVVSANEAQVHGQRVTGLSPYYTDKFLLSFEVEGSSGCAVTACSESQVTSVLDMSTNYCNLRNLYCGASDGCTVVTSDFSGSYNENYKQCWQREAEKCIAHSQ